jgi:hypothetical protein
MNICEFWQPVMLELYFCYFYARFVLEIILFQSELIAFILWGKALGIDSDLPCKQLIVPYRLIWWQWPSNLATLFGWDTEYATHVTPLIPIYLEIFVSYSKWGSNKSHILLQFQRSYWNARWCVEYIVITFWIITC